MQQTREQIRLHCGTKVACISIYTARHIGPHLQHASLAGVPATKILNLQLLIWLPLHILPYKKIRKLQIWPSQYLGEAAGSCTQHLSRSQTFFTAGLISLILASTCIETCVLVGL